MGEVRANYGNRRIVVKFALLPTRIGNSWIWLREYGSVEYWNPVRYEWIEMDRVRHD